MYYITKRDGRKVSYNRRKIERAMEKAFIDVDGDIDEYASNKISSIADYIENKIKSGEELTVEAIQDLVVSGLMNTKRKDVATAYVIYREDRSRARGNSIDNAIEELLSGDSEYWSSENSNKNEELSTTQRDYMAGIISTDLTMRKFLPKDVVDAHNIGAIHFHDADYFAQHMHNCDLVNLEDMLQNGTIISGTAIEKPHSFSTACNVATQIIAQVASAQYGGQSISLAALAPFVDVSRKKIKNEVLEELEITNTEMSEENIDKIVAMRLAKEINKGVQTIQYQVVTLMTTNGQAPFITVFMYLDEVEEGQLRDDLALIIEETLKQRIIGVKNEKGVYITPAFPKLIYCLDEDNITEDSKYFYLTELAAKCSAKRLVPDYISAKIMKQLKGDVYTCMGCVDGEEIITYKFNGTLYVEGFSRMWSRMSTIFPVLHQYDISDNPNLYMDLQNVEIFDTKLGSFTSCYRLIRNVSNKWIDVNISNGRRLLCTADHPFEILNRGVIHAENLIPGDKVLTNRYQYSENNYNIDPEMAWTLGVIICDGNYSGSITISIAANGEDEIEARYMKNMNNIFGVGTESILRERGPKGTYKDIISRKTLSNEGAISETRKYLNDIFEGEQKIYRHFPSTLFSWNYHAKLAFLAGMIDADGYINCTKKPVIVQLGSTNKELALQQMALAQALGMTARIYFNHYNSNFPDKIRYRIEFEASLDLIQFISCQKKVDKYSMKPVEFINDNHMSYLDPVSTIVSIRPIYETRFSYDVTTASEHFEVSGIYSHNCRSFLTPDRCSDAVGNIANAKNYIEGKHKYYGRFNQGVVTINLVDVACSSNRDIDRFWEIFDERLELCRKALMFRHNRLKGTRSDVAPILWQHGALARLEKGEVIDKLLYNGYSTISLGYAGLYECVVYMTGKSHTDPSVKDFALEIMQYMNDKCSEWKAETNIDFSLYGTPLESTTYKFAKCLKKRFGIIEGVTDHNYITNSYHINVRENISWKDKLTIESEFQKLSPGGAISYIETPNMQDNIPAVIEMLKFMYNNIMYAEINTKSDYCQVCGYDGEIMIRESDNGTLFWECPNCNNRDENKLNVARRTCGYIGSQFWNQGRTQEIKERVLHIGSDWNSEKF